jgi:hypothetical protein
MNPAQLDVEQRRIRLKWVLPWCALSFALGFAPVPVNAGFFALVFAVLVPLGRARALYFDRLGALFDLEWDEAQHAALLFALSSIISIHLYGLKWQDWFLDPCPACSTICYCNGTTALCSSSS